jgi:hypothetical protein
VLCIVLFAEIVYRRDLVLGLCLEFAEDTIARERGKRDLLFFLFFSSSSTYLINNDNCRPHIRCAARDRAHLVYHHLYLSKSLRVSVYSVLILRL